MSIEPESDSDEFKQTDAGMARRWHSEMEASKKALQPFVDQGLKVDKVFRDEREDADSGKTRWNFFWSDTTTLVSMLYGNTPKSDVSRRFGDAADDVGRVAGEIAERLLHTDIEKRSDTAAEAFGNALWDWRLPGAGWVRVRYQPAFQPVPAVPAQMHPVTGLEVAPAVPASEKVSGEEAPIDYVHWQDVRWSPCRVWDEVTWIAFAADMPKKAFLARFGGEDAKAAAELWGKVPKASQATTDEEKAKDPWARVRVWEIWHKEDYTPEAPEAGAADSPVEEATEAPAEVRAEKVAGRVYWWVEGYEKVLDVQDDPLGLEGFWPCPKPLFSNLTTSKLVPRSDYYLAQDLYLELNRLCQRIDRLQRAIKVAGVYDASNPELQSLLDDAVENELKPSANWAALAEKGGIRGQIDFLPIEAIANALMQLRDYRREVIDNLAQVTGRADIMRGSSAVPGETATASAAKARFGSVRVQRMQDEFARFVSDAQALKLEVVAKHFRPETIFSRVNAEFAFGEEDSQLVPKAIALLQSNYSCYRVEVKPESITLTDFAQLKADRTEVIQALSTFFQAAMPVVQTLGPDSMAFMLKMLQSAIAGLRGSSTLEGTLDGAIQELEAKQKQAAMQPKPPAPPDPKVQAEQLKMQGEAQKHAQDMEKEQFKAAANSQRIQEEAVAHDAMEQSQAKWGTKEQLDREQIKQAFHPQLPPGMGPKPGGFGSGL